MLLSHCGGTVGTGAGPEMATACPDPEETWPHMPSGSVSRLPKLLRAGLVSAPVGIQKFSSGDRCRLYRSHQRHKQYLKGYCGYCLAGAVLFAAGAFLAGIFIFGLQYDIWDIGVILQQYFS